MWLKTRTCYTESKAAIVMDAALILKNNTLKLITLSRNPLGELTILKIYNCSAVTAIESKVIVDRNILSQNSLFILSSFSITITSSAHCIRINHRDMPLKGVLKAFSKGFFSFWRILWKLLYHPKSQHVWVCSV